MRILYLGLPMGALMLHREGHEIVAACVSRPASPGMRRLRKLMADRRAPLLGRPDLTQPAVQSLLAETEPELLVSWFWTKRVPAAVTQAAALGGVNAHPSLLPRHRGADPYFWSILHGDKETGVTVHRMTAQYDDGPILLQRRIAMPEGLTAGELARYLDRPSLEALRDAVSGIADGILDPRGTAQDHDLATDAPRPSDDDCEVRWDEPAPLVLRRVFAAAPEPGAFTAFNDATVVVLGARVAERPPRGLAPGDVVLTAEGVVAVCGGNSAVVITAARDEAGEEVMRGEGVAALFPGVARVEA